MKKMTVIMMVLALAALTGCGKNATVQDAAQEQIAISESGDPIVPKEQPEFTDPLVESVTAAVGCSNEEAKTLLGNIEAMINAKAASVEVVSLAELPAGVRRIIEVKTPNEGESYLVSVNKDYDIIKVVLKSANLIIYDAEAGIDLSKENIK